MRAWLRYAVAVSTIAAGLPAVAEQRPSNPLTLHDLVSRVLSHNPELQALDSSHRAAKIQSDNAGRWKNPRINFLMEDFLGGGRFSGLSSTESTLSLTQPLELGGKRGKRSDLADATASVAQAKLEQRKSETLAQAVVAFIHVGADQRRFEIAGKATELATQGLDFATRRVRSGAASSVEKQRAKIALARSKLTTEHAEHELRTSRRKLASFWGAPQDDFASVEANLFEVQQVPSYETLASRIEQSPALIKAAKQKAVQTHKLRLAQAQAVPDLKVILGGRRTEGPAAYSMVLGVSVPLPLFDRNQGNIGAEESKQEALAATEQAKRLSLLSTLYEYVQELIHANVELQTLTNEVLPDARNVLEVVTGGFRAGRFSQIELLEAQRSLVDLERERVDAAQRMWTLAVRLNSLLGVSPLDAARPDAGATHE